MTGQVKGSKHAIKRSNSRNVRINDKSLGKVAKNKPVGRYKMEINKDIFVIHKYPDFIVVITVYEKNIGMMAEYEAAKEDERRRLSKKKKKL